MARRLSPLPEYRREAIRRQLREHSLPKERAESSLHEFVQQAWEIVEPGREFIDGWHIRAICDHLEAAFDNRLKDLLINVPPGTCKSKLCNVFFPAWAWTKNPEWRFFHAAHSLNLTTRDSIACRNVIESEWYMDQWPKARLVIDQNQKMRFDNISSGWRIASTVGSGTGEHPDAIIADDCIEAAAAMSDLERRAVINWWDGTISTRGMMRGCRRIVIMQRLHEDDLSGHLIRKGGYTHVCLPMRFEPERMKTTAIGFNDPRTIPGELLWPEGMPKEIVDQKEIELGPFSAPGQLQQRPVAAGGGAIKAERIQLVDALPSECSVFVRYWDLAATLGAGDFTAGVLLTFYDGKTYVVDVEHGQWDYDSRNERMLQVAEIDGAQYGRMSVMIRGEQEGGASGKEVAALSAQRFAGYNVQFSTVTGSKVLRVGLFAGQVNAGNVRMLRDHPDKRWNQKYIRELSVFPVGSHDDMVDGSSGAYNQLQIALANWYKVGRSLVPEIGDSTPANGNVILPDNGRRFEDLDKRQTQVAVAGIGVVEDEFD